MERNRNIITITAYVLLMVLFFMFGYLLGRVTTKNSFSQRDAQEDYVRAVSSPTLAPVAELYNVKMSDGSLILSRIDSGEKEILYSIEISESIFPPEDIKELKAGVTFSDISDAHAFIENFTS